MLNQEVLGNIINKALSELYDDVNDKYLILNRPVDDLENHVSERAIVFRFGIYLQYLMSKESDLENYDLDCEYNRALYSIKRLPSFENGVYPDLIIHKRGEMEHNLLVMEIKTWWNSNTDQDCKKLREFVSEKGLFKYKYGLSILVNKDSYKLNWVLPSGDENDIGTVKLCDIAEIVMGQSPKGDTCNTSGIGIPLLNGPTEFGSHHPTPVQFTTEAKKFGKNDDILFCVRGSTGRMNWADQKYAIGRGIAALSHKEGGEFQPYLKGIIEYIMPNLLAQATGSVFPNVSREQLCNQIIPNHSLQTQKKIASILSSLDDKIEINTRMNKVLEEIARALFHQWFVEFEFPDEKGRPYKSSGGKMAESEMGPVPEGWSVGTLGNVAKITMGQSPNGKSYNEEGIGEVFYQGRAEFGERFPTRRLFTTEPKRMAEKGDVLMSVRAPVGDLNVACEKCCIGRGLAAIQSIDKNPSFILYTMLELQRELDVFNGEGTVFGSINKNSLHDMRILIPSQNIIDRYEKIASVIDLDIERKHTEIQKLIKIRDSLLPKLMNGEIEV